MKASNAIRAAVRKHALASGQLTSSWTEEQILAYAAEHGIDEGPQPTRTRKPTRRSKPELTPADPEPTPERESAPESAPAPTPTPAPSGSIEDAIKALVASTATPASIDEAKVVELIEKHSLAPREVTVTVERKGADPVKVEGCHRDFPTVLSFIAAGVNVAAVGPAGSGKSTIFEQAAESLGLDYYFQGAVQQEHKVLGYMDANGQYHRTQFRDAYENGGLFVFEEFDGSSARALLAINNAVAGSWCDFPDGKVRRHDSFVCVMAGNTYGTGASRQYVGRQQLDDATLDRFAFLEIDYDETLERSVACSIWEEASDWVSEVQGFRAKVKANNIRHIVSPRATFAGCKLFKAGALDSTIIKEAVLYKALSADQRALLGV